MNSDSPHEPTRSCGIGHLAKICFPCLPIFNAQQDRGPASLTASACPPPFFTNSYSHREDAVLHPGFSSRLGGLTPAKPFFRPAGDATARFFSIPTLTGAAGPAIDLPLPPPQPQTTNINHVEIRYQVHQTGMPPFNIPHIANQQAALALNMRAIQMSPHTYQTPKPPKTPKMPLMNNPLKSTESVPEARVKSDKSIKSKTPSIASEKLVKQRKRSPSQLSLITIEESHRLLASGDFSDCEVIACGHTFKLHKAVICYRSDFFMKALTGSMREAVESRVTLPEETELDDIQRFFKFVYEKDYHTTSELAEAADLVPKERAETVQKVLDNLWLDIRMYSLGKKYLCNALMDHALFAFQTGLENDVLFPVNIHRLQHAPLGVSEGVVRFVSAEPDTVPSIIDLCRRTFLEGEDLSEDHKEGVFELVFKLYPCLSKFDEFREALLTDLGELAGMILCRVTLDRSERMIEHCACCKVYLVEEAAMEMASFCHDCKRARRIEDIRVEETFDMRLRGGQQGLV